MPSGDFNHHRCAISWLAPVLLRYPVPEESGPLIPIGDPAGPPAVSSHSRELEQDLREFCWSGERDEMVLGLDLVVAPVLRVALCPVGKIPAPVVAPARLERRLDERPAEGKRLERRAEADRLGETPERIGCAPRRL